MGYPGWGGGGSSWGTPCPDLAGGTHPWPGGYPHQGIPPHPDLTGVPPGKVMGPVEVLWDGDGVSPPPEQTHACENITSCRTTYAGGNDLAQLFGETTLLVESKILLNEI